MIEISGKYKDYRFLEELLGTIYPSTVSIDGVKSIGNSCEQDAEEVNNTFTLTR
jgi:hypothetical protein